MENYSLPVQIRWSDLDPNVHVRHSVYYDWGAYCRVHFLNEQGLTSAIMQELQIGPILLKEECVFRKEVRQGDDLQISISLLKAKRDFSRWSIQHSLLKNGDTVAAIITVDGAWLDTVRRRLASPTAIVSNTFLKMPLHPDFTWLD
jgi:acyl-CoA thioester hydrolase